MVSIAKKVRDLLNEKPFLEDAIIEGIANLSKITKIIKKEIREESFHAVHAALRRYIREHKKRRFDIQKKVLRVLKDSKISVRSKLISVYVHREPLLFDKIKRIEDKVNRSKGEIFNIIEGESFITLLLDKKNSIFLGPIKRSIYKTSNNLGAVILVSPEIVEKTVGFVAFITNMLAKNGINLIDFIYTFTDTIIVVSMPDVSKTFELLSKYV